MKKLNPNKAFGSDDITNRFLKTCGNGLISVLTSFFQICVNRKYHFKTYWKNNTMILRKSDKNNYDVVKTWRSIALLNTMNKIFESIISKKLSYLAEHHGWLPVAQMEIWLNKSTETVLELFIEQMHTMWKTETNKIATLLNMNVAKAFSMINHVKLIHNFWKKKMFNWIINWMSSFVENQNITFIFINCIIEKQIIRTELSQDLFMSFILYLFFNAGLLELIDRSKIKAIAIDFVNDINLLIYEKSTKENCAILKRIHFVCVWWTRRHNTIFVFEKYELIYLSHKTKRFNMCATMKISDVAVESKINIKMLKLQIDIKLKWHSHMKIIKIKIITQCMTLFRILIFTWKAFFIKTKQIYSAMIRPAMIYVLTIWHEPINKLNENPNDKFLVTQNKCLRMITNAFKTIPIWILKTKMIVSSFNVHLNRLQAEIRMRLRNSDRSQQIRAVCDRVTRRLRGARGRPARRNSTPGQRKMAWTKELTQKCQNKMVLIKACEPWTNNTRKRKTVKNKLRKTVLIKKRFLRTKFMNDWISHWMVYQNQLIYSTPIQAEDLGRLRMKWHIKLMKMKNNLITQMRIKKIELAKFLHVHKISRFDHSNCFCGASKQTSKHVMMNCSLMPKKNEIWRTVNDAAKNYRRLMTIPKTTKTLTRWFIKANLLFMFSLTKNQLYWGNLMTKKFDDEKIWWCGI